MFNADEWAMNADEDRWKPMKTDETVEQEQLGSCQLFADEQTGHGTIPLLPEGVAAGRGNEAPAARRAVENVPQGSEKRHTTGHPCLPIPNLPPPCS